MLLTLAVDFLADIYKRIGPKETPWNPHLPLEYRAEWYLTPHHHALETIVFGSLYMLIALFMHRSITQKDKWKELAPARSPTTSDWVWFVIAITSWGAAYYYRHIVPGYWRLAYMLQPCHMLTGSFAILSLWPGRTSNYIFQVCVSLTWSSVIAIVFPDMSDYTEWADMFNYWYEHALILLIPIMLCRSGRFVYLGDWHFIVLGYAVTGIYHSIVLQVACLVTEVNIATMAVPPAMLAHLGIYYRAIQYGICFTLHLVYNLLILAGVYLVTSLTRRKPIKQE
ncbi:unnamed protein product [Aphanomyces euteiches]